MCQKENSKTLSLNNVDLDYYSRIARIYLTEIEMDNLKSELENIADFLDTFSKLDTLMVEQINPVASVANIFRADEVKESYKREEILSNAPSIEKQFFKVPKAIDYINHEKDFT